MQTTIEETYGSPSENIQQSSETGTPNEAQEECDEENVDALLRTPDITINAFGTLDWEEGWPQIPRKWLEKDVTEKASNSNIINKAFGR